MFRQLMKRKKDWRQATANLLGTASTQGALAGSGVSQRLAGGQLSRVIRFVNRAVALTDNPGVVAYLGTKIMDFPEGLVQITGCVVNLAITKSSAGVNADWDGDFSVGSVTAANDATLTSTEADVVPSTATPQAAAGATTAKGNNTASVLLDGTAGAKDLYLNVLVDDADHNVVVTPCNLIFNGTIEVTYDMLGDR